MLKFCVCVKTEFMKISLDCIVFKNVSFYPETEALLEK